MSYTLGIDFGTTNSCISYYDGGRSYVIQNETGKYTTPSCIYFSKNTSDILYGNTALEKSLSKNGTFISNIKRLLGITYKEYSFKQDLFKNLNVERDTHSEHCCIVLEHDNKICSFTPQRLVKLYLTWLLNSTRDLLGGKLTGDVVITVPVNFNHNQRMLLKDILGDIGYNVLRILNEPTAATMAYIDTLKHVRSETIMVIDCGGGTTDFTILEADYENNYFEVIGNFGDDSLGGEDITNNLVTYVLSKINCELSVWNVKYIRQQSEICKRNLTNKQSSNIFLENIRDIDGEYRDYNITISQNILEMVNREWFEKFVKLLNETRDMNINKVVLVGGTTRMPKIRVLIKQLLDDVIVCDKLDPDHTISMGAARRGYSLTEKSLDKEDITFLDTISMSLGIKTIGDVMTPIVSKNTIIPCSHTELFVKTDNEKTICIEVYAGERRFVKDNYKIGEFTMNLDKNTKGDIIQLTFDITSDSTLIVTARDRNTEGQISCTFNCFNDKTVDYCDYEDEDDKITDMELSNLIIAKIELSNTVETCKNINHMNTKNNSQRYVKLISEAEDIIRDYKSKKVTELREYKIYFQKMWNDILFL